MKGIVVHLQAVNGDDGNVKIKLRSKAKQDGEELSTENVTTTDDTTAIAPKKKKRGLFRRR